MIAVKEMPAAEKYAAMSDNIALFGRFMPAFVADRLGDQAVSELRQAWHAGLQSVPEGASLDEKYEIAYGNWVWMGKCNLAFVREKLGEDGLEALVSAEAEALKQANAGVDVLLLGLIRAFAPGRAFEMLAKDFAYKMQWVSPLSVTELSRERAVINFPRCKIVEFPDTDDACYIGCQKAYPRWVAEQFKARLTFDRQDTQCTCTLTPLA